MSSENYVGAMNRNASTAFIEQKTGEQIMLRNVVTIILIGGSLAIAACNTVRGAGEDVKSVANCTEDMINRGQC